MNTERTPVPFGLAIAGVLATLAFAWQATVASPAATGVGSTFVAWIPRGYAFEAVAIGALTVVVLHPARIAQRWSIDAAWIGCGALMTIALMSAMTVGGTLVPGLVLVMAAAGSGTRQMNRNFGRATIDCVVGAVAQAGLMGLVIAAAMILLPRSG